MGKQKRKENIVTGLDIGTTKICVIVGEISLDGVNIIGIGTHPSRGMRKGVVVNIDATVNSIKKAVEEAEIMAGCEIKSVYAGIAGGHIRSFNSHGVIAVKNREITEEDVRRVIDAAAAIAIPVDREVIHVIPQEFIIDDQEGIREPLGMSGVRLEAKVHIVTGAVTSTQNIIKCTNRAGIEVCDIVLQPLASSEGVLTQEERELGVMLIDIGGGTTDIAIFHEGCIKHTAVIAMGGNQVTGDIAVGLRTPAAEAEKIKIKYGCAWSGVVDNEETIEVPGIGGRKPRIVSRRELCDIIQPRMEEILTFAHRELIKSGYDNLIASGVVLTGGTAHMPGLCELAEQIFDLPVREGIPIGISGLVDVVKNPMYATGVGLVLYGARNPEGKRFTNGDSRLFARVLRRMKEWFLEFF